MLQMSFNVISQHFCDIKVFLLKVMESKICRRRPQSESVAGLRPEWQNLESEACILFARLKTIESIYEEKPYPVKMYY